MTCSATEPRIRIDVLLHHADYVSDLNDLTFWSLRGSPRELPAVWLYDEQGSRLFDRITRLPAYYLARREREILGRHALAIAELTAAQTLIELGSGTSVKTRFLLDALSQVGTLDRFMPVDVSEEVLRASAEAIAVRYADIGIHGIVGDFERHLAALPRGGGKLIAFLGSTIGNLYPWRRAQLFNSVADVLDAADGFLLGVDLVKGRQRLEAAYNDRGGLTERFLRNALDVVNRRLGASFEQDSFDFTASWDEENEWVDIGFRARKGHVVRIAELEMELLLERGEQLRVEVSTKFRRSGIEEELAAAGLRMRNWWTDSAGDFALLLAGR